MHVKSKKLKIGPGDKAIIFRNDGTIDFHADQDEDQIEVDGGSPEFDFICLLNLAENRDSQMFEMIRRYFYIEMSEDFEDEDDGGEKKELPN
jgi:hypothetical protein